MGECEKLVFGRNFNNAIFEKLLKWDSDGHQSDEDQEEALSSELKRGRNIGKNVLQNMLAWCSEDKNTRYSEPSVRNGIDLLSLKGELYKYIRLMHPYEFDLFELTPKGLNNTSVVLHITGFSSSVLLTGDLEPGGWQVLQKNHPDLRCDVLKFPHHGGAWDTSNTKALLDAVQPSIVVISVGTSGEKYKHPNKEVFDVLSSTAYSHIRVLCTQATNQCCQTVLSQRMSVIQQLDHEAKSNGYKRIGSKRGCPCAGTIVFELDERVNIVQPSIVLHQDKIILSHFQENHKCAISPR